MAVTDRFTVERAIRVAKSHTCEHCASIVDDCMCVSCLGWRNLELDLKASARARAVLIDGVTYIPRRETDDVRACLMAALEKMERL